MVDDVPVDSETLVATLSISMICRFSHSEVLIRGVLCACTHRARVSVCAFVSVCICTVFRKKMHHLS